MPKLNRIYTSGIGTKVARFSPLTVDFRDNNKSPDDTIVWLRNGGGKTCWLALVYSIFRPRSPHFLLKKAKGKDSSIMDFIQANDLAFVITEWDISGEQPKLATDETDWKNLRIVGQVMAWRNGQKSDDRGKLKQFLFSFRCSEKFNLETMPVMGFSQDPAKSFEEFTDWLHSIDGRNEPVIDPGLDEWEEHLIKIGIDPALIQFQITMNQREGDIDQYFKEFCNTPEKFTFEFLKMAFDPGKADKVSANIIALKSKLQRREPLQQEQVFIGNFLGALEPFLIEVNTLNSHKQTLELAQTQARGAKRALSARITELQDEKTKEESSAKDAQTRAETAFAEASVTSKNIAWLQIKQAQLEAIAAQNNENVAQNESNQASEHSRSCRAAKKLAKLTVLRREEQSLQQALSKQNEELQPIRDELTRMGAIYRELLRLQILAHDQNLAGIKQTKGQLEERRNSLSEQQMETKEKRGRNDSDRNTCQSKINARESQYRALLNHGIVDEGETAITARERWGVAINASIEEVRRLKEIVTAKTADSAQLHEAIVEQRLKLKELSHERQKFESFIFATEKRRERLEVDQNILEITGGKIPDLGFANLAVGLKNLLANKQRDASQADVDSAEDHRANKYLDQIGLLPPSLDVEKALQRLKEANIQAFSALRFLSENELDPEEALKKLLADPSKFTGIIVNRREELEEARKLLTSRSSLKGPVQVSISSLDAWETAPGRITLPPASSGAFSRTAAEDERSHIFERLNKHKANRNKLSDEIESISTSIRNLGDYLENFASKLQQNRSDLETTKTSESAVQGAIIENEDKIESNKVAISALDQRIEEESSTTESYRSNVRTLSSFIRDLDTDYEANKQRIKQLTDSIQVLDELSASLIAQLKQIGMTLTGLDNEEIQHKADRKTDEKELADVQEFNPDRPDVSSHNISQIRTDYKVQLARYNKVSTTELHGQCKQLKNQIGELEKEYNAEVKDLHKIKVEALAVRSTLATDTQVAETESEQKREALTLAKDNHKRLQVKLKETCKEHSGNAMQPEGAEGLGTIEQTKAMGADCQIKLQTKMEEQALAETETRQHKGKITDCDNGIKTRTSLVDDLAEVKLGEGEAPVVTLPPDDQNLKKHVREIRRTVIDAEAHVKTSQDRLDEHFDGIQAILDEPDEPGFENAMKIKIKEFSQVALVQEAADIKNKATIRRTIIEKDLEAIEQDRQGLIIELEIIYQEARSLLHSAERVSRLPENMTGWAGLPFLRIKLPELSPNDINVKLREMLDAILKEKESPDGQKLAHRCIIQLAGLEGIKITILKPDVVLRPDRIPVQDISYFSGGEGVTTAILLYCTLLQLRAQMHGKVTHSKDAGALLLDNPIGKCSRPDLLKMHREISSKMQVQLIYLTGVNDVNAIGTFPRIVRLKNQHKNIRNGDLHITIDSESQMEKAEIQMAHA